MNRIADLIQNIQIWIRSKPLLYRFTLGTRSLLAIGFIPTGMVKLLGYRFTNMSVESEVGAFFEIMYQGGPYWKFLGLTQVLAGILVLIPATSAMGALLFLGIMMNIFFITISYNFALTPIITFLMLLGSIWLVIWDFNHFRDILFQVKSAERYSNSKFLAPNLPDPTLANRYEKGIYAVGTASGLLFFSMLRGLVLPAGSAIVLLSICILCFIGACILGIRYRIPNW